MPPVEGAQAARSVIIIEPHDNEGTEAGQEPAVVPP